MKYYIIAGEASGDLHGGNLMEGIYDKDPEARIRFWGGDSMNEVFLRRHSSGQNCGLVRHYREGAVMGIADVFAKARKLLTNLRYCKKDILDFAPDCVILIDYPGFNFRIAEFAHKKGLKVIYYIAPKVWASREGRIRKLKKYVDRLYIIFPFEIPYFESKGVKFVYKGNPLVDAVDKSVAATECRRDFFKRCGLDDKPVIALLAGSRKGEISTMMPVLMELADRLHAIADYSDWQFLVAGAPGRDMDDYSPYLGERKYVKVLFGETQSIIKNAEAAVVNSGTASLETALLGTPQVVGFIFGSSLTFAIAKKIVKVKYISLGNLILNKLAFRELLQKECNAEELCLEVRRLIEDSRYRQAMIEDYSRIREKLGSSGTSAAVATDLVDYISGQAD
ncbi:MAG: lipid-A-disaccharide synthase [Candidatus Cryptobacteroides sp.]|nr:lipid-A-disaccharide synthase [Candidatus Cryptobacteroides sp.]